MDVYFCLCMYVCMYVTLSTSWLGQPVVRVRLHTGGSSAIGLRSCGSLPGPPGVHLDAGNAGQSRVADEPGLFFTITFFPTYTDTCMDGDTYKVLRNWLPYDSRIRRWSLVD
ncbi:hypothetical protein BX600DRAFT_454627 [Xylariales sp. PMI_506]|nr:hypothetical protein BX600DRAFT_454627 [Xylariales sp. PMI_506]